MLVKISESQNGNLMWGNMSNNKYEVLEAASTEQLLEMVLDYPLLVDIFLFDTVEEGIENVACDFNGFKELMSRPDFEKTVLERYITTDINDAASNNGAIDNLDIKELYK